ncbi:glycosyltransferase family 2 protein [Shewanella sp. YIC-542]|uniref:glycosyltransferase family 2 protein n=1 Tax=Shewanella mytili TaxID=3377111 RepID=UPI00398E761A
MVKNIAICILTLNESHNIKLCIESLKRNDFFDIHVIDSGSKDETVKIAQELDVKVYVNIQSGVYSAAEQRNWALINVESPSDYLLFVDADEILPIEFGSKLLKFFDDESNAKYDVYSIPLLYHFHGKKIKSMGYPNWHDRLISRNVHFVSSVGEFVPTDNRRNVESIYIVHNFNSLGMRRFIEKQARYAEYIGSETFRFRNGETVSYFEKSDHNGRLKRSIAKLNFSRPFLRFCYLYFYKGGIFEGREGFIVAFYMSVFEFMVVLSALECERVYKGQTL